MKTVKEILRYIEDTLPYDVIPEHVKEQASIYIERFASQDKWISGEVPKDGTKILRWLKTWSVPQVVYYNERLSNDKTCVWITGDCSNSYPEESFLPDLYQPLPKAPNTK